ncbi:flavodoxin family protein [Streptomyces orinoci]|uniref:NAD(P)H-dependent oxidoreductase n=1 Tax=Streptomyces orinoci TaxID=67339 RepID=A0ABV3JRS5_STRON|nr:NAD(P)H-dependent oxidoreductase [Streptomyces orinoci]
MTRQFLFLLGSARTGGNTEALARRAAEHLPAGAGQRWLRLSELELPDFEDLRHSAGRSFAEPVGAERLLLDATLEATDLVIVSPLYWYSVSAHTKLYLDYWAGWLRRGELDFRKRMGGRTLWAVSALSEEDPSVADPMLGTLRLSARYMGMNWGGGLLGYANRPGDITGNAQALAEAEKFFLGTPVRQEPAA